MPDQKLSNFQFVMRWCDANRCGQPQTSETGAGEGLGGGLGGAPKVSTMAAKMIIAVGKLLGHSTSCHQPCALIPESKFRQVMRGCEGIQEVVEKGCAALRDLCLSAGMTESVADRLASDGVVTALLRGMLVHPSSHAVQAHVLNLPKFLYPEDLAPCTQHPPPSTLHPPPSTLHPPPSTLHPPPSTQNLKPYCSTP